MTGLMAKLRTRSKKAPLSWEFLRGCTAYRDIEQLPLEVLHLLRTLRDDEKDAEGGETDRQEAGDLVEQEEESGSFDRDHSRSHATPIFCSEKRQRGNCMRWSAGENTSLRRHSAA